MKTDPNHTQRTWRRPSAKALGIASGVAAAGAAVVLSLATAMVVNADQVAAGAAPATISEDSTSSDAPEATVEETGAPAPLAADKVRLPREPLTIDEVAYARALASAEDSFVAAKDAAGQPPTYLSTTIATPEAYDDGARRFEVVYYDYATDQVMRYVVNLTAGTVEIAEAASGVQPPPSDSEITLALELYLADPLSSTAKQVYLDLTGEELAHPDQTVYNGSSFVHTEGTIGAEECGAQRCVMLLVQTPDHAYLPTTTAVVNLSTNSVIEIK